MWECILYTTTKVFLEEELKSCSYKFVLFNFISWSIDSSGGGALSFNSRWIKWLMVNLLGWRLIQDILYT